MRLPLGSKGEILWSSELHLPWTLEGERLSSSGTQANSLVTIRKQGSEVILPTRPSYPAALATELPTTAAP